MARKQVKQKDIDDATTALAQATSGIQGAETLMPAPDDYVSPEADDGIVQTLHTVKSDIQSALSALGGKPCGGGRPC